MTADDIITYNSIQMRRDYAESLEQAQRAGCYRTGGTLVPRIRFGMETYPMMTPGNGLCPCCSASRGQLHEPLCEREQCPVCKQQIIAEPSGNFSLPMPCRCMADDAQEEVEVEKAPAPTAIDLFDGMAGPVLKELREVPLNAWSGETESGQPVHLAFRFGKMTVAVDLPTPDGGLQELTLLRWKPRLALGIATPWERPNGNEGKAFRAERARLAETCAERSEIRAINGKAQIFSESEVRGWLEQQNRHFKQLSARGVAGGKLRFRIIDLVQAAA